MKTKKNLSNFNWDYDAYLVGECIAKCDCSEQHLHTNQEILIASRDGTSWCGCTVIVHDRRNNATLFQNSQANACKIRESSQKLLFESIGEYWCVFLRTLPEWQKDDRFNSAEFEHRLEWRQQISGGKIKQIQSVQCQRYGDIVEHGNVDVATVSAACV